MDKWFIFLLTTLSYQLSAQDISIIEKRIDSLFWHTDVHEILEIAKLITWQSEIISNIPCIPPVMPKSFSEIIISSDFGYRVHPISQTTHIHSGIDIPPCANNDTIYSPANGIIDTIGYDNKLGYYIAMSHKYNFKSVYGHLSTTLIHPHQFVYIGQPIAIMGTTGGSTGKHLHYTIKHKGENVAPLPFCSLLLQIRSSLCVQ